MLFRDPSQLMQLLVLGAIVFFYGYFLYFQKGLQETVALDRLIWWNVFLAMTNFLTEGFIVLAFCTRFVFPSVSLEGRNFLLLKAAPRQMAEIVRAKYLTWLLISSVLCAIVFGSAAFYLYGSLGAVGSKIVSTLLLCVGSVAIAVATGSFFANFSWEHPSQLAASFGSMAFMLMGVVYVAMHIVLMWMAMTILIQGLAYSPPGSFRAGILWWSFLGGVLSLNIVLAWRLLRWAGATLSRREAI